MSAPQRFGRWFWVGLALALVVAGVLSYFASGSPDGLESVAEKHGFASAAEHDSSRLLTDYQIAGIEVAPLSGGLAGVIGVLVVLALALGLVVTLRRVLGRSK